MYSDSFLTGRSGDRIPAKAKFFTTVQTGPGARQASRNMGTGSFPRKWSGRDVALTTLPHLTPRLKKSRAGPLTPFWAFMACSRLNLTFCRETNPISLIAQFAASTNDIPTDLHRLCALEIDFLKWKFCGLLKLLYLIHVISLYHF